MNKPSNGMEITVLTLLAITLSVAILLSGCGSIKKYSSRNFKQSEHMNIPEKL